MSIVAERARIAISLEKSAFYEIRACICFFVIPAESFGLFSAK
jgi:hypothetical protein